MLYVYNGKVYVKPYENKIVEVTISKNGDDYDVKATDRVIVEDGLANKLQSISLEEAYELINRSAKKSLKKEEDF